MLVSTDNEGETSMNPSPTSQDPQGGPPYKKPQIGRREIGAFKLLAINWMFVVLSYGSVARQRVANPYSPAAGLRPEAGATPTAEHATLIAP